MSLDDAIMKMARDALDTDLPTLGGPKSFRFFTAADCRNFGGRTNNESVAALATQIEGADLVTVGELIAREEALAGMTCPRCSFENALTEVVYAGSHIQQHFGDRPEQLSPSEQHLLEKAREWLADDTITRCLQVEEDK